MQEEIHNVIIIGSGPAAYSAALYLKHFSPLLIEGGFIGSNGPGGQLTTTTKVDNYPGFVTIEGPDLMQHMFLHSKPRIISETAVLLEKKDDLIEIKTDSNNFYKTKTAIIATGASAKRLIVDGTRDDEFWNRGVSSCAVCDGWFFKGKICVVIGGGDSAMEETQYLAKIAKKVILIHRRNEFRARKDFFGRVQKMENVEILTPFFLKKAEGTDSLESITIVNTETNEERKIEVNGLFFGIGHDPNTKFLKGVNLCADGFVKVDEKMRTNLEGVFACGDVQDKKYKQANTAAASGCLAALAVEEYLKN